MDTLTSLLFGKESWPAHITSPIMAIAIGLLLVWATSPILRLFPKKALNVLSFIIQSEVKVSPTVAIVTHVSIQLGITELGNLRL